MNLKPLAANMTEIEIGTKRVLFSYKTPVASVENGKLYITDFNWSRTTKRHISKWWATLGIETSTIVPQSHFDTLLKEVK